MKKLFFFFVFSCFVSIAFSQSTSYYQTLEWFRTHGYTVASNKYCDLKAGGFSDFSKEFARGLDYQIYAFSDDNDVLDVDLYLFDEDGSLHTKEITYGRTAEIDITPVYTRYMTIRFKNAESNYPNYSSRIRVVVAYK